MRTRTRNNRLASSAGVASLALALLARASVACTDSPDVFPECVGPGAYCPDDAGSDSASDASSSAAPDAGQDAGQPAADAGQDVAVDGPSEDAGNG